MHGVNHWLMTLSFLLGLLLTFAFTIRRVKREVPMSATLGAVSATADTAKLATSATSVAATGTAPYGDGSARVSAGSSVPSGWTIKGNEDSMLYHTTESPWYEQTIAELWFRNEKDAETAGFTRWDKKAGHGGGPIKLVGGVEEVVAGPYGIGSTKAGPGGSGPVGWTIKGNEDSMLYHGPASPAYDATIAEVWFLDEETAAAAGFERWDSWRTKKKKK